MKNGTLVENYRGFDICYANDGVLEGYEVRRADFGQHSHVMFDFQIVAFQEPTVEHVKKDIDLYLAFVREGEDFRHYCVRIERLKDLVQDYGFDIKRYLEIVEEYEDVFFAQMYEEAE